MPSVPAAEIDRRVRAVQDELAGAEPPVDLLLVVQKADLFYLSGTVQQCHLALPAEGSPRLLVRKVLETAEADSPIRDIVPLRSFRELPGHVRNLCGEPPWRIGMELDVLPVDLWRTYRGVFGDDAEIVDCSPQFLAVRSRKSEWELDQFRDAARIHPLLFADPLRRLLAEDVSPYDLELRLEAEARALGHCGLVRLRGLDVETGIGIAVSGPDGAVPSNSMFPIGGTGPHAWVSHGGTRAPVRRDVPIILDFLMSTTGYHVDCSRMAVRGAFPDRAASILERIGDLLRGMESRLRAGVRPSEIYRSAVEEATAAGLGSGFMGPPGYQVNFVGHGVGLEVNELPVIGPRSDRPLQAGNVIALEPKYTDPEYGVIGIENTYVVNENGAEKLTTATEAVVGG
jgi:Xaa-Pro aminopeptidase